MGRRVIATYGATDAASHDSATFVALDDIAIWYGDIEAPTGGGDTFCNFDFTDEDLATLSRGTGNRERGTGNGERGANANVANGQARIQEVESRKSNVGCLPACRVSLVACPHSAAFGASAPQLFNAPLPFEGREW